MNTLDITAGNSNDFAASNPYPSCEAVAIRRNDLLEHYLP